MNKAADSSPYSRWITADTEKYKQEILLNFCLCITELKAQFKRYDKTARLSFPILSDMLGEPSNKGILWRLKDTAHLLLSRMQEHSTTAIHLDWTIGYLFHECVKIVETAYQLQNYGAGFESIRQSCRIEPDDLNKLTRINQLTNDALKVQIMQARTLIEVACTLFIRYLQGNVIDKRLLKFATERQDLLQEVFEGLYPDLLDAVHPASVANDASTQAAP